MRIQTRLVFLFLFLALLIPVGYLATGSLSFIGEDFWFNAGLILLLLCALIDQPFFPNNSDILLNGVGAAISLLAVDLAHRNFMWWFFLGWSLYLIVSSYVILWIRSKPLRSEHWLLQFFARFNRKIGRPQVLFSAFFLWGVIIQLGLGGRGFSALFIYWVVFILADFVEIGKIIERAVEALLSRGSETAAAVGRITAVLEPGIAIAEVDPQAVSLLGKHVLLGHAPEANVSGGYVIDDRRLRNHRLAKIVVPGSATTAWEACLSAPNRDIKMYIADPQPTPDPYTQCVGVVEEGSDIDGLRTFLHPGADVSKGQLLTVNLSNGTPAYYQAIRAQVQDISAGQGELYRVVSVRTQQLGKWNEEKICFEPITWVAPAGAPVHTVEETRETQWDEIRNGQLLAGLVPRSDFPVYLDLDESVTLNTAILGVTGCGKSFLASYLIEHLVDANIKVLVLDVSRQHRVFLARKQPTLLTNIDADLQNWLNADDAYLAIHEYDSSLPTAITANLAQRVLERLGQVSLQVEQDRRARLCIVFEEAHSLIPEWNQCNKTDQQNVNKTARHLLQFRKYGIGCIIISQRTANVTKTILNQCNTIFAMQCFDQTGFDFLKNYMGENYARTLSMLPQRHAVLVGKASSSTHPIIVEIPDMTGRWGGDGQCADDTALLPPGEHTDGEMPRDFIPAGEEIPF